MSDRVLRGGSWNNNQDNARAVYRSSFHPNERNNNNGFRLVAVGAPHLDELLKAGWKPSGEACWAAAAARLPEMPAGYGLWDAAEVIEMAQACPVRTCGSGAYTNAAAPRFIPEPPV